MKGLRVILWVCAIACLLSFVMLFIPWRFMAAWITSMGVEVLAAAPFKAYMARLILGTVGLVGIFFAILATDPLLIFMGLICLAGGIRYHLPPIMFYGDMIFCLVFGALILVFRAKALSEQTSAQQEE